MKIRKGLLAAATAATVSISGMTVPAFAQEPANTDSSANAGSSAREGENGENKDSSSIKDFGDKLVGMSSNDDGELDPNAIKLWIGVFTAFITALGALFTFIDKNFK